MKKTFSLKKIVSLFLFALFIVTGSKSVFAEDYTNTTITTATPIEIGQTASGTFFDYDDEVYYYKLTIPNDIGNKYITFSLTNYSSDDIDISIRNQLNQTMKSLTYISTNGNGTIRTRTEGASTTSTSITKLSAGNTYYIEIAPYSFLGTEGDYVLSITSTPDDNWGTFENAAEIKANESKAGKIEYWDDIDCYYITLPNDKRKYTFILSADDEIYALFADANGLKICDTTVYYNTANNSFSATGSGQKIFIRLQPNDDNEANYTIKILPNDKTISKLKLTKYKKDSKKIVGKTIKNATVKITVNKKNYTVKSNNKGTFKANLKKKLKSKQKIKISVSKTNYKTKTKTFKVK